MNYLIYVERSAENLQFYMWHQDYVKRFEQAKTSDLALAPEWTQAMEDEAVIHIQKEHAEKAHKGTWTRAAEIFSGTDFEKTARVEVQRTSTFEMNPFSTPPQTPGERDRSSEEASSDALYRHQANEAFAAAGIKLPCELLWRTGRSSFADVWANSSAVTVQPFRKEIDRVIATYIMDEAPRQLNLSDREQKAALRALAYTTHPSALRGVATTVESTLRTQAHPNFIRWSICNGNPARILFARSLGVGLIIAGLAVALVLSLSRAGRGYRAVAAIIWVLGIATLIAAWKGMCVVLHGMHHCHIRPWELFVTEEDSFAEEKSSFDSFGTANSYEEEPWVIRYQKRNIIRKIFDREVWIKEPALRQIQDTIFVQSMLCALVLAGILTMVFVLIPGGNFF